MYLSSSIYLLLVVSLFFYPEDGGDMFLRNVGLTPNKTVLQPMERNLHSSDTQPQHIKYLQSVTTVSCTRLHGSNLTAIATLVLGTPIYERYQIFYIIGSQMEVKTVNLTRRPLFTSKKIPGTHFY
jgi:hypothetical protein